MECGVHLLRMLLDASIKTYGLLLAKNPEKYINDYLKNSHNTDFASRSECKYDGRKLSDGVILKYMEKDGYPIEKFYDDANRNIHPSNFYCLGVELDADTRKWLWDSQDEALISSYAIFRDREEREWVYNTMGLINDLLLEVMVKVVEMIEAPVYLPEVIDLSSRNVIPNPKFYAKVADIEKVCGGFVEGDTEFSAVYLEMKKPNGIYCGYVKGSQTNPKGVSIWCNDSFGNTLLLDDAPDELTIDYQNRRNKDNPMFWMGYIKDGNLLARFYPDGITKDMVISNLKEWYAKLLN